MRIVGIKYKTKISLAKYDSEEIELSCELNEGDNAKEVIEECRKLTRGNLPYRPLCAETICPEDSESVEQVVVPKKEEPKKEEPKKEEPKKEEVQKPEAPKKTILRKKEKKEEPKEADIVPTFKKVVDEDKAEIKIEENYFDEHRKHCKRCIKNGLEIPELISHSKDVLEEILSSTKEEGFEMYDTKNETHKSIAREYCEKILGNQNWNNQEIRKCVGAALREVHDLSWFYDSKNKTILDDFKNNLWKSFWTNIFDSGIEGLVSNS